MSSGGPPSGPGRDPIPLGGRVGHYEVSAVLGRGGMGEVWRATDTRLGREVALKAMPPDFADDPDRHARFEREARVLASLNHPHIATLYGLEHFDDQHVLVMELVEGEGLDERLARGPMAMDEAIQTALQIADALEAAHEAGIVHRDLKPANIRIRPDGTVKVLDFGLAKSWDAATGDSSLSLSPTMTRHATAAGVILGTAAYMSPEQARGRPVDRRADVWAFAVVLWEMLTGRRLFEGDTVSDVLASVLKEEPDLASLPADTPAGVRRLLARCLQRDPKRRLQWIGDARFDLEEDHEPREQQGRAGPPSRAPRWREGLAWLVAAAAVVAAVAGWWSRAGGAPPPLVRLAVELDDDQRLSFIDQPILALSPDGQTLALTASTGSLDRDMILLRHLDRQGVVPVAGSEGAGQAFFSPDGASLAFFADGKLKRVSVDGGPAVTLADAPNPRGGVWLPDHTIVYSPEYAAGLWRVADSGGTPELLLDVDAERGERTFRFPDVSPDGRTLLYTVGTIGSPNDYTDAVVEVCSLATRERTVLVERANTARFVTSDLVLFARSGDLFVVSLDPAGGGTRGEPVPVIEDVGGDPSSGAGHFAVAANGTLAWIGGAVTTADSRLVLVDAAGTAEPLPLSPRGFYQPRFSPDGRRLAFTIGRGQSGVSGDVWTYTLADRSLSRLTFGGNDLYPAWTPDGHSLAYLTYTSQSQLFTKPADGSGSPAPFGSGDSSSLPIFPESFSPDGSTLAVARIGRTSDIYLVTDDDEPRLFEADASCAEFSPDGRWIAFASPGSGTTSVFVRPVAGEGRWQVSPDAGGYPRWSGDGRTLYYIDIGLPERPLMAVDVDRGDSFRAGPPRVVFDNLARYLTATAPAVNWDVARAGDRFVFVELDRDDNAVSRIDLAINWARHLDLDTR